MTRDEIDAAYEIDSKIPDWAEKQARYTALSAALPESDASHRDVAYGSDPRQTMDIFSVANGAQARPAILFFHGGYWKGGSKDSRRFPAAAWTAKGVAWVSVEYRLAPAVRLDDIVDDVRSAVAWFHGAAVKFGCDPAAIHVAGNSAGGHIAGSLLADGWQGRYGLPADTVKSGAAISGLFEFDPLLRAYTQEWLALDDAAAARNSPLRHPPRSGVAVAVSWGSLESQAFARQSQNYAERCRAAGAKVEAFAMQGHDHYSIIGEFADPSSALFQAVERNVLG